MAKKMKTFLLYIQDIEEVQHLAVISASSAEDAARNMGGELMEGVGFGREMPEYHFGVLPRDAFTTTGMDPKLCDVSQFRLLELPLVTARHGHHSRKQQDLIRAGTGNAGTMAVIKEMLVKLENIGDRSREQVHVKRQNLRRNHRRI